ncbi:MAG: SDR family NAD(P)-dependent oxidoreductase, partial [Arenimonas sp.]
MKRVDKKTCIITGASLGIGKACAQRLADEGANIALFDREDEAGNALAKELQDRGVNARYWHVDVASEKSVQTATEEVAKHFGSIDVLVNNAGIAGVNKPTHEVTEAEWDLVQSVNVKGVFFCTKHAIPFMKKAGCGSIINLSSIYGLVGAPDVPPYHASKGAVRLMSKTDALIYAPDKIRVNSIHPGFIWTPMVEKHLHDSGATDIEAAKAETGKLHPLGHMG